MAANFFYTLTVQLEYTNHLLQFFKLFSYYAGIMLNAFSDLLCSKLYWHNRLVPSHQLQEIVYRFQSLKYFDFTIDFSLIISHIASYSCTL